MAKVVIFGLKEIASLAHFYLRHDSPHEVVAFTVDEEYLPQDQTFEGKPVTPFESIEQTYPAEDFYLFAPLAERKMNRVRAEVFQRIKEKEYRMISYVSSKATVFPEASIGENCFILEDNTLQPFTPIGNNVVLWSGNHIGHHGCIQDHVFFTSQVTLSGRCTVEPYCFFGVNSTIRDGLRLAEGTLVAMAAAVTADTDPWSVYAGVPAKKRKVSSVDVNL